MKAFEAKFDTIIWRYYLMMASVIIPFFLGVPLISLIALPLFLISILGISFKREKTKKMTTKHRSLVSTEYTNILNEAI